MEIKLNKNLLVVIEIVAVLAIMSAVKWIADSFQIIGAGCNCNVGRDNNRHIFYEKAWLKLV